MVPIGKLVDDDAVGTKVYDAHGLTKIVATRANGIKNVLRIHTEAGHALDVTADRGLEVDGGRSGSSWRPGPRSG